MHVGYVRIQTGFQGTKRDKRDRRGTYLFYILSNPSLNVLLIPLNFFHFTLHYHGPLEGHSMCPFFAWG